MKSPCKILLVDDSLTQRLYFKQALAGYAYELHEAENGVQGLEMMLEHRFDLLLVDINMPKMDGYEFVQRVRKQDTSHVPIVMVSSEQEPKDWSAAMGAGANLYLTKPVQAPKLAQLVELLTGGAHG